jgi:hypothetical protein
MIKLPILFVALVVSRERLVIDDLPVDLLAQGPHSI